MKKILVPVDFSKSAGIALTYISKLSQACKAELIVHHVLGPDIEPSEANVTLYKEKLQSWSERHIPETCVAEVSYEVSSGDFVEMISKTAISGDCWLIGMGTKGASGLKEMFVGSNTVNLIDHVKVPVLIIPDGADYEGMDYILLATDYKSIDNDDAFDVVKEIAMCHEAEVRLAHVKSDHKMASEQKVLERHRQGHLFEPEVKYSYKVIFDKKGVIHGLNYYIRKKGDNDLMVMINRNHGLLRKTFLENRTQRMAFHAHLPLLVVHE